ncbi:MAG: SDR family NAD(P)-dependent oxidoreductase [Nannocystaceae bacterium]
MTTTTKSATTTTTTARTAVVTGATSGLGQAAAIALAARGYRVLVVGRDQARGDETVATIRGAGGRAELVLGDLMTVAGAEALAAEIAARAPSIDLLINNAGGAFNRDERTGDGLERTFALNVLAPYILTERLIPALAAARGRVVNVVTAVPSGAKTTIDAIAGAKASAGMGSYVRNKLALVTVTIEAQRRLQARGITLVSLHPGVIPGTRFGSDSPGILMKIGPVIARMLRITSSLEAAADRFVQVGAGEVEGGGFYYEGKLRAAPRQAADPAFAGELRAALDGLVARAHASAAA